MGNYFMRSHGRMAVDLASQQCPDGARRVHTDQADFGHRARMAVRRSSCRIKSGLHTSKEPLVSQTSVFLMNFLPNV